METNIATDTVAIDIECGQDSLEQDPSCVPVTNVSDSGYNISSFEAKSHFALHQLYKDWKMNGWGKSPICIPAAMEVHKKWFIRAIDPNAVDYNERVINNRLGKLRGDNAERIVHQAFQRSNIGGILIQGVDYALLWDMLKKSSDISSDLKKQLKPNQTGGTNMFEIDFLLFHPIGGIFIMECKAYDESKNLLSKECKSAMGQAKQASQNLLDFFKVLTGIQFPSDIIHFVLCLPNLKKEKIEGIDQNYILDEQDLTDNQRFQEFWKAQIFKHQGVGVNYLEDMHVSRLLVLTFGFRSAEFTSSASNSIEIFRKIDSQKNSGSEKGKFDFGTKTIFLNSEQLMAYNIAKSGQNMVLFGPPGSGKTLLIQLLAKKASENVGRGRVVLLLAYRGFAILYENFFKANRENQKREIIINPSNAELLRSLASDSFDDIFADEMLFGGWIPKENRPNGQIIVGIAPGRRYEKSRVSSAKEKLEEQLINANFCFFELKSVMRNTGNIYKYYSKFERESNNDSVIGHNIEGSNVIEITTNGTKNASIAIANRIKEYLGKDGEGKTENTNYYCSPTDIAVLVAHEPVSSYINQIKKALKEVGIESGSITEQLVARAANENPLVAVDCSANVLSLEWPIVFVINATQCPYSKNIASPIVSYSRAVSSLIVVNSRECNYPYFRYFCKSDVRHHYLNLFKKYNLHLYSGIIEEMNQLHSLRLLFQFCLGLMNGITYIGNLFLLLSYLMFYLRSIDDFRVSSGLFLAGIVILVLLYIALGVVFIKIYRQSIAILADLIMIYSFFFLIFYSVFIVGWNIIGNLLFGTILFTQYIIICFLRMFLVRDDHTDQYVVKWQYTKRLIRFFIFLIVITPLCAPITSALLITGYDLPLSLFLVLLNAPFLSILLKLSFPLNQQKSISIQPLQS